MNQEINIKQALQQGANALAQSATPNLDAQLLLAFVLDKQKAYLYAYPEQILTALQQQVFAQLIQRRQQGEPIAYLLGEKEFWSLRLKVSIATLVPRPETECLVEWALSYFSENKIQVADLGTGSGAIALALASERPQWDILGTDKSVEALAIAEENRDELKLAAVQFAQGSWFQALPQGQCYDLIISNPPYVAKNDPDLEQAVYSFEPQEAVIAKEEGFADLKYLIQASKPYLKTQGILLLEHGCMQQSELVEFAQQEGFSIVEKINDRQSLPRALALRI